MGNQMRTLRMGERFKKTPAGEIPVDWEVTTFGEAFDFLRTANNSRDDLDETSSVGYIHYGDLHTKWRTALRCDKIAMPRIDASKVEGIPRLRNGDLVMADASEDYAGIGTAVEVSNIGDRQVVGGLHTLALRDKGGRFADGYRGYIQYIPAVRHSIMKVATGASVYGVSKGNLVDVPIPRPPLGEQEKIAEILSSVDEAIGKTTAVVDATRELQKALRSDLLIRGIGHANLRQTSDGEIPTGWEFITFGDSFDFLRTGNNPREDLKETEGVGYLHYGDLHTKWHTVLKCDRAAIPRISQSKVGALPRLRDGDLIMADASEDYDGVGAAVEICNVGEQQIVAGLHTILLRDKGGRFVDGFRGYIQYMPAVRRRLMQVATGAAVFGLSKGNLSKVPIPRPSPEEQRKIADILVEMDCAVSHAEAQGFRLIKAKAALIAALLTGKVRTRSRV